MMGNEINELHYREGKLSTNPSPKPTKYGIYVIRKNEQILRVGESASGYSRIRKGFQQPFTAKVRGKLRKNYVAYSWRKKYESTVLTIDYFPLTDREFENDSIRRALEAELTFQIRVHTKKWPEDMIEIHFSEAYRELKAVKETCATILSVYGINFKRDI